MKAKVIRFILVFFWSILVHYLLSSDRDIVYFVIVSTIIAMLDSLTAKPFERFITYAVKKIVKPR